MSSPDTPAPKRTHPPVIGGGFIVLNRTGKSGRLRAGYAPHEHGSQADAETEAARLAAHHRREFVVFQAVSSVFPPVADTSAPASTGEDGTC
ncbi:hypothetical protein [Methylobacterium oryzihabitans]|uniref:Uncharacterized protein n=1 Tax=Methylobacterium oryzihabitans TaxID=2499852 RepID=A0A3S2YMX1_9HYPH|nr:hypothetical protein [Methylobacterium oryzihabitans]RVU15212.1 hypothetical protein EOE48_20610 [Methylobacterium oryzihabitans]